MRFQSRLAACVLLSGLLAGCGSRAPERTGIVVTIELEGVAARQLQISVDGPSGYHHSAERPGTAGDHLASPQSVTVFLPDGLAGQDVTCTVTPLDGGQPSAAAGTGRARLILRKLVPTTVRLTGTANDGGADDAADAAEAGGAAGADGASDGAADSPAADAGPKGNGQRCATDAECDSAMCVDGFCCDSACTDSCEACNLPDHEGTCSPVASGDPTVGVERNACADQGAASCGFDGKCDGNGACRKYRAGITCKPPSCQGTSFVPPSACDGQGSCVTLKEVDCAPYNCATSGPPACASTCTTGGGECASPAVCVNGSCGPRPKKANSEGCLLDGDCLSNHCADGVCCNAACTGACVSCNQPGAEGVCQNVPAGKADPHRVCTDAGAATCKTSGLCNGSGACALYPTTTVCLAGSCKNNTTLSPGRHCDGNGACVASSDQECTPFRCNPAAAACYATCSSNAQCVQKHPCVNNACLTLQQ
ncbi:MAG TPA: hypothetical protein VHK47_18815 [Polyangia bacterium]|nr:hypothetical protein [Polyangia bacterium]